MKTPLTIQILIKDNRNVISKCIMSLLPLNAHLNIVDLGSTDGTAEFCRSLKLNVSRMSLNNDYSGVRNQLINYSTTDWNMFINPWEVIISGCDTITSYLNNELKAYQFAVIQGDLILKQIRLWNKKLNLKFSNPIYESVKYEKYSGSDVVIAGVDIAADSQMILDNWLKTSPLNLSAHYYKALDLLSKGHWKEFINVADYYLFSENRECVSKTMTEYYYALTKCYLAKDYNVALKYILNCIAKQPLMAEFWCLLGDIYYANSEYQTAIVFYENATILGSQRLNSDEWPVEMPKYNIYPNKMIASCRELLDKSKIYSG